jgi:hypothetical protein
MSRVAALRKTDFRNQKSWPPSSRLLQNGQTIFTAAARNGIAFGGAGVMLAA